MKKCPDCRKEVIYGREYCPHCSGALYGRRHLPLSWPGQLDAFVKISEE